MAAHPEISATELAEEFGIGLPFFCMIKYGDREPRIGLALRICARCNIPIESLIKNELPPRRQARAGIRPKRDTPLVHSA